jgi:hypothetical protein
VITLDGTHVPTLELLVLQRMLMLLVQRKMMLLPIPLFRRKICDAHCPIPLCSVASTSAAAGQS